MTRVLSILILLAALFGGILIVRYIQDSYNMPYLAEVQNQTVDESSILSDQANYETWREFAHPSGKFKVLFPVLPQHVNDKIIDPATKEPHNYSIYVASKGDGTTFMISAISFPNQADKKTSENLLKNIVNEMLARNKNNQLKMLQPGTFRNFNTMDFSIENNDITLGGKAFVHNETLYVLAMLAKQGAFNKKEFDFFINSFDLDTNSENSKPHIKIN